MNKAFKNYENIFWRDFKSSILLDWILDRTNKWDDKF